MNARKRQREKLAEWIIKLVRSTGIPDQVAAFVVKALHYTLPYYLSMSSMFLPLFMTRFLLFMPIVFILLFVYMHGCVISVVEYRLNKNDPVNVIDPILCALGMDINNENRYDMTLFANCLFFFFMLVVYFIRTRR